jgi:hypothetical protein
MTTPTADQLEAAFSRMRADDWPATLHELAQAAARMKLVESAAKALARGERVPTRQAANDMPTAPVRAFEHPARLIGARPTPSRRHGDGPDLKRLAAGDRDD